jgi:hypothetical protein
MLKQMKKTLGILLAVCFLMSVTAAAVSAGPTVVKDKKTVVVVVKDVKTKIFKHPHSHTCGSSHLHTCTHGHLGSDDHHNHHHDDDDCWVWSPTKDEYVYVC